jgi:hypothetical protein
MPKKMVEIRLSRPHAKEEVLDESRPHSLAEFVEESMRYAIFVEGLPDGSGEEEAARGFATMEQIMLRPLDPLAHYFYGWFPKCGRPVVSAGGKHLFTIVTHCNEKEIWHRLIIEEAGRELLLQA